MEGAPVGVRLTIEVHIAVVDEQALRNSRVGVDSGRDGGVRRARGRDRTDRLDLVLDADRHDLVVMAASTRSGRVLMTLQDQLERVPGLQCHDASARAAQGWPDAEDL